MADEDSTEQTPSLQSEPELEDETPVPKTRREKLGAFLQSNPVQYGILALVVIDVIIVILEILIDFNMITIPENDHSSDAVNSSYHYNVSTHFEMDDLTTPLYHHDPHALRSVPHEPHNEVHHNVTSHHHFSTNHSDHFNSSDHHLTHHEGAHHHSNKETVEHVLHYSSLTILAIFVVEVFCKLIAEGLHFFKHKAEVFDALVVLVSFSLDIAFSFISVTSAARDATGLMVLLRLWRVTRIVNGVIMSVKKDADKKIAEQKHGRLKAEAEVDRLRSKVESLQKELDNVKRKLKKQTSNPNGRTSTPVVISVDEPVCSNNIETTEIR